MIDLTPLDVRNKRGDFKKLMRGYDPQEVDVFLEFVAERLEMLTRENIGLRERSQTLQLQVNSQTGREQAVQEALVTAQELRADIRGQAQREADNIIKEAETEARRMIAEAEAEARTKLRGSERRLEQVGDALEQMERRRTRFIREFRQLLERELDVVEVEEDRKPLEERTIDLDLGSKRAVEPTEAATRVARPTAGDVPPLDAPVDELAAAYQSTAEADAPPAVERSSLGEAMDAAPPAPRGQKHDNLMLYLDADDEV
jgi:DivIVA domain-containing protein